MSDVPNSCLPGDKVGAWKCVVRASVHQRGEEGRAARLWMPFRQSLLCADGPLMGPCSWPQRAPHPPPAPRPLCLPLWRQRCSPTLP